MSVLAVHTLTKRYGARAAVDGLSFEIPAGTVFGLLGPNGAGKTTTIRLILSLARPTSGDIELAGRRLGSRDYHLSMHEVGSMIEEPALYRPVSGRRNLEIHALYLGLEDSRTSIEAALDLVRLRDRADDKVKTYSQGMRQRLGLAIALLARPKLVILDEPTNGLDPAGIAEFRDLVRKLPEAGTTVLLSSHLLGEVQQVCDRVAIVHLGRLVAEGPTGELIERYGTTTTFHVELLPADVPHAFTALQAAALTCRPIDATHVAVDGTGVTGRHIAHALTTAWVYPEQIVRMSMTLEQVFLSLTAAPGALPPVPETPGAEGAYVVPS